MLQAAGSKAVAHLASVFRAAEQESEEEVRQQRLLVSAQQGEFGKLPWFS